MGLEQHRLLAEGQQLVDLPDGELGGQQGAAELHPVQRHVHHGGRLGLVAVVAAALREVLGPPVLVAEGGELVLVEGAPHHHAAHLEVLVVLLPELPLLSAHLLPEQVDVDGPFDALLGSIFLLFEFHHALEAGGVGLFPLLPPHNCTNLSYTHGRRGQTVAEDRHRPAAPLRKGLRVQVGHRVAGDEAVN